MRLTVKRLMVGMAASAVAIAFATGSQSDYLSCHLCHNRKEISSRLILGFPVVTGETEKSDYPIAPGHKHSWSRYGRSRWFFGGASAAGRPSIYADGSAAPDGRH